MTEYIAYRTCPLCEATCGLKITVKEGVAVKVEGDRDDVFSNGYICPKGAALGDLHYDPDRLRKPLVRKGGELVEVEWDEAFSAVEAGLTPVLEKYGRDSVGVYLGNPCAHTMAGALAVKPMLKALGGRNIFSASTVDQIPKQTSCGLMFGHPAIIPVPDVDRTHYLVIIGADPLESNGSLATAPDWPGRLRALKKRGGRLTVIDPRRTRTADLADKHMAIRPGGDPFLLAALVNVLFNENLASFGTLESHVNGLGAIKDLFRSFTPEAVEDWTGLSAAAIRELARELSAAPSAAVYGRMGVSTAPFGAVSNWLIDVVNILTGNLDRPGGAMFPTPAHMPKKVKPGGKGWGVGRWRSRVKGLNEVMGELPVCTLCDEIETEGEGRIRALLTVASNPVIALPNASRVERALAGLDFMVSVDFYVTASTRHADVILPPTGPLSTAQYDFAFYNMSVRNIANYSPPILPRPEGEMDKWEILCKLAMIFGGQGASGDVELMDEYIIGLIVDGATKREGTPLNGRKTEILKELGKYRGLERQLDFMLRTGAWGDGFGLNPDGLTLEKLMDNPHGIDLGPLEPRLPGILKTPSGRVELAPAPLTEDVERLKSKLVEGPPKGLVLIGRRHLRTNNSWMPNIPSLVAGPPRCVLLMNPADAEKLELAEGDQVKLTSRVGAVIAPVELTDGIREGVVSLPHGWGHDLPGVKMETARACGGVNSNILSDDEAFDQVSNNAVLNGVPVLAARAR